MYFISRKIITKSVKLSKYICISLKENCVEKKFIWMLKIINRRIVCIFEHKYTFGDTFGDTVADGKGIQF